MSGAARRRDRLSALVGHIRAAGRRCAVIPTGYAGHARLIAAAAAADPAVQAVVAMGGDGTIREVAAGLAGGPVPLAVLPAGTENLFAKVFGFTPDPAETADRVLSGRVRRLDMGVASSARGGEGEKGRRGEEETTDTPQISPLLPISHSPLLPLSPSPEHFTVVGGVGFDADVLVRLGNAAVTSPG